MNIRLSGSTCPLQRGDHRGEVAVNGASFVSCIYTF